MLEKTTQPQDLGLQISPLPPQKREQLSSSSSIPLSKKQAS